ncbi:MFS transporter [Actinacidiphila oryziradicis]|uniref:MFS transporter n=1 Tax=Actinacidiphila oryziradicis TaxID=2571141 RepID=A0A4U0SLE7_9ACTN|nr:MFS transporter [Actinacidiphila oryziradicis]TKA10720.1 MFS transporter [Actinacidiphila oryziradicis]
MSRPDRGSASYRAVLALPRARGLFAAAMLARLSYGMLSLPLLLSLRQGTGSYAVAGTATGLFGLAAALLGPFRARLVEGRHAALMILSVCYTLLLASVAAGCALRIPALPTVGLAVLAGMFPPPVGPLMRTLWGELTVDEEQRQRALSLDTAAESTVFALGPVFGAFLITFSAAPMALGVCAVLVITGFSAFAAALGRSPAGAHRAAARTPIPRTALGPLRAAGFVPLLLVVLGTGCALSLDEIAVVAAWGAGVAGPVMALFSVGGVLGGLAYGRRQWRATPGRRLLALAAFSSGCYALPALLYAVPGAGVALLLAGACTDALLITSYLLVDTLVPGGSRTEAGAWVNTAYNLGTALGAGGAGLLIDRPGPVAVFAAAAVPLGAATALGALRRSPLRRGGCEAAVLTGRQPMVSDAVE